MISKQDHARIVAHMQGKVYQTYDRLRRRLAYAEGLFHWFEDLNVVEFGCNAGFYAVPILQHARTYTGVDISPRFIAQARVQHALMELEYQDRCRFVERRLKGWLRDRDKAAARGEPIERFQGVFMSFALYHFNDNEIALLGEFLKTVDVVIVQTRTQKRRPWRDHNSHRFWEVSNVERYLKDGGFFSVQTFAADESFADTVALSKKASQPVSTISQFSSVTGHDNNALGGKSTSYKLADGGPVSQQQPRCKPAHGEPLSAELAHGDTPNWPTMSHDHIKDHIRKEARPPRRTVAPLPSHSPPDPADHEAAREGLDLLKEAQRPLPTEDEQTADLPRSEGAATPTTETPTHEIEGETVNAVLDAASEDEGDAKTTQEEQDDDDDQSAGDRDPAGEDSSAE